MFVSLNLCPAQYYAYWSANALLSVAKREKKRKFAHISEKLFKNIIIDFAVIIIAARTFAQNFVLVGTIFFELRLLFLPGHRSIIVVRYIETAILCERQCFRISPLHVTFKKLNLYVYVRAGREKAYSRLLSLFS